MSKPIECTLMLAGEAGQGVQTIETLLVRLLRSCGHHVFATKEYMSRVRGGCNSTTLRVSARRVAALSGSVDLFMPLSAESIRRYGPLLNKSTVWVGDPQQVQHEGLHGVPFTAVAVELGDKRYAGIVAAGALAGLLGLDAAKMAPLVRDRFADKDAAVIDANLSAAERGFALGRELSGRIGMSFKLPADESVSHEMLLNGSEAVALGAVAGGCDAIFAYPMSPGTGVLTEMARLSKKTDIVVEQVEDEIAAINMALGASYAGARAMVTTSGGGFALMTEGVSLAGIIETPVVIHIAQRPGPGTGLPTRTEQGDLNLALHAGHGFFPRAILAPGTLDEAFRLAAHAFHLADHYQIPVFILTDQYLVDTYYNVPEFSLDGLAVRRYIVEAPEDYQRYRLTENGLSPRGIPGWGPGRVRVDSDEHDESGRITEDLDGISLQMKDKRFRKFALVQSDVCPPEWIGPEDAEVLFVAWGSTGPAVREALANVGSPKAAALLFTQVWPLPSNAATLLGLARTCVAIENSQRAVLADWLKLETGCPFADPILKYNGLPFSVKELAARMKEVL